MKRILVVSALLLLFIMLFVIAKNGRDKLLDDHKVKHFRFYKKISFIGEASKIGITDYILSKYFNFGNFKLIIIYEKSFAYDIADFEHNDWEGGIYEVFSHFSDKRHYNQVLDDLETCGILSLNDKRKLIEIRKSNNRKRKKKLEERWNDFAKLKIKSKSLGQKTNQQEKPSKTGTTDQKKHE